MVYKDSEILDMIHSVLRIMKAEQALSAMPHVMLPKQSSDNVLEVHKSFLLKIAEMLNQLIEERDEWKTCYFNEYDLRMRSLIETKNSG